MAAVNDALRGSRELAEQKMAAVTGGLRTPGLWLTRRPPWPARSSSRSPASSRRSPGCPGSGPKTAQRLTYHLLRAPDAEARALAARADRRPRRGRLLRALLQHQRRAALPDLPRPGPRRGAACASSRSRSTCWPSSGPASSTAATTSCTARSRRSTASARSGSRSASCSRASTRPQRDGPAVRGGHPRHQPDARGRGDGDVPRRAARGPWSGRDRIARGLPVGGDLEYADDVTLIRALQGRRARLTPRELPRLRDPAPAGQGRCWPRCSSVVPCYCVLVGRPLGRARLGRSSPLLCWLAGGGLHPPRRERPDLSPAGPTRRRSATASGAGSARLTAPPGRAPTIRRSCLLRGGAPVGSARRPATPGPFDTRCARRPSLRVCAAGGHGRALHLNN